MQTWNEFYAYVDIILKNLFEYMKKMLEVSLFARTTVSEKNLTECEEF